MLAGRLLIGLVLDSDKGCQKGREVFETNGDAFKGDFPRSMTCYTCWRVSPRRSIQDSATDVAASGDLIDQKVDITLPDEMAQAETDTNLAIGEHAGWGWSGERGQGTPFEIKTTRPTGMNVWPLRSIMVPAGFDLAAYP
jgi:hypothetical protein